MFGDMQINSGLPLGARVVSCTNISVGGTTYGLRENGVLCEVGGGDSGGGGSASDISVRIEQHHQNVARAAACYFGAVCVLVAIASIVHAVAVGIGGANLEAASSCTVANVRMSLAQWLVAGGSVALVVNIVMLIVVATLVFGFMCCGAASALSGFGAVVAFAIASSLFALFSLAWFVTGIVIISSVPPSCAGPVYAMTIVELIVMGCTVLSMIVSCFHQRASSR